MSRHTDREQLVAQLARELPERSLYQVVELARKLSRAGATLQRLAEAQCNGEWPADNGVRETRECDACSTGWHPSVLKRCKAPGALNLRGAHVCPNCRTRATVTALLAEYGMRPIFQGDPRGAVFKVIPPSYAERNTGKDQFNLEGIYVA
jgi:hypothetical protein